MDDPFPVDLLNGYIESKDDDRILHALNRIIKNPKTVSCDISSSIRLLLKNEQVQTLTAQAVAELAKMNDQRSFLSNKVIINDLLTLLNKAIASNEIFFAIQLCRALGNLCFENNDSSNILAELNVIETFTKLLNEAIKLNDDQCQQFRSVICGFLLNFLMHQEDVLKSTWESGLFLDKLELILNMDNNTIDNKNECSRHIVYILGLYSDTIDECFFTKSLNSVIVDLLKRSENLDISEMCLQLLQQQCESDNLKFALAKCGLCETLYSCLEKHISLATDPQIQALVQQACEIIVTVLTGDDAMHYLYGNKDFVQCMINWLSSTEPELLVTGVLAIGNFSRTEQHCIDMVENGIMNKLLYILSKHKSKSSDIRLQHALLSALRNIAIPQQNKSKLIECNLVPLAISMLDNDHPSIIYKILGTLRMLVICQENVAIELLKNEELISKLADWADNNDHPGVSGESPRLIAWLIKYCGQVQDPNKSDIIKNVILSFVKIKGSIACLINMLSSSHEVMQNEGLLALIFLLSMLVLGNNTDEDKKKIGQILLDADIISKLNLFLKATKNESKELLDNAIFLIKLLMNLENIRDLLIKSDMKLKLESLQSEQNFSDKLEIIQDILNNFSFQ